LAGFRDNKAAEAFVFCPCSDFYKLRITRQEQRRGTLRHSGIYPVSAAGLELGYNTAWLSPLVLGVRVELDSNKHSLYGESTWSDGPLLRPPSLSLSLGYQIADSKRHLGGTQPLVRAPNNLQGESRRPLRYIGPTVSLILPGWGSASTPGYLSSDHYAFLPGFEALASFDWWYLSLQYFDLILDQYDASMDQWELNETRGLDLGLGLYLSLSDYFSFTLGTFLTLGRSESANQEYDREEFPGAGFKAALNIRWGNNLVWTLRTGLGTRLPLGQWVAEYGMGLGWAF
jgi:hypothetical protein